MLVPEILSNGVSPLLATVAAPLVLVPLILQADSLHQQRNLHPLDATDTAGWNRSGEWLVGAPIEKIHRLPSSSSAAAIVADHSGGEWRTLRRHGSVQSVTLMQPEPYRDSLVPCHSSVGNEYLKVMASAYAALSCRDNDQSNSLHLGLGGGSLPMLLGEPCKAIELDGDAVDLAIEYCGLDPELVSMNIGDALHHKELAPGPHSCVFVDVFGGDNNVPLPFVQEDFVRGLWESLEEGGLVIANFHCNRGAKNAEDERLDRAKQTYANVFGSSKSDTLLQIPSRYQGNMILCARKGGRTQDGLLADDLDIEHARTIARQKGWRFDPGARLEYATPVSLP